MIGYALVITLTASDGQLLACEFCSPPSDEHFNLWLDVVYSNVMRDWAREFFIDRRFDVVITLKFDRLVYDLVLGLPFYDF